MESEKESQFRLRPIITQIITVLVVDIILIVIVGNSRTSLFFLGLLVLFGGYGIERLFYGGQYVYMGRGARPKTEYDRYKIEEGATPGSELQKQKSAPSFLRAISIAGVAAIILSFVLPWLS